MIHFHALFSLSPLTSHLSPITYNLSPVRPMTFLQPFILWGLPLALLPVLIHLINRMRYRSLPWAAMMFLLSANRSSTRFAQLRQILILCCRALAVLGLILALSRPLAGGWLGWMLAPAPEVVLILLDRSASMEAKNPGGSLSKRAHALQLLSQAAKEFDASRFVLIENALRAPQEIAGGAVLPELSMTAATDTAADLPAMLQAAADWLTENRPGVSEIWIASDLQRSNWQPESDRWPALVSRLASLPQGTRVRLMALNEEPSLNVSISVFEVNRKRRGNETELDVTLDLQRNTSAAGSLPLAITMNGARTQKELMMEGQTLRFHHKVNLGAKRPNSLIPYPLQGNGWGQVELPADANARDNTSYLVYGAETILRSTVASVDTESRRYLKLAAAPAPKEMGQICETISPRQGGLNTASLRETSLVLWQELLPQGEIEQQLRAYVEEGGIVIFFPPGQSDSQKFCGGGWGEVQTAENDRPFRVARWDESDGPLAKTEEGMSLPVAELAVQRRQTVVGEKNTLASFEGGEPFLTRHTVGKGRVFFCASLPKRDWSNLGEGSVLVPMTQRLLQTGGKRMNASSSVSCGEWRGIDGPARWVCVDSPTSMEGGITPGLPSQGALAPGGVKDIRTQAGVYRAGDRLVAVNRPSREDERETLEAGAVRPLFGDIPLRMFQEQRSQAGQPLGEMWRFFLFSMLALLLAEAALILPADNSKTEPAT